MLLETQNPHYFDFFGDKISQKVNFPTFVSLNLFCNMIVFSLFMPSFLTVVLQIVADSFWLFTLSAKSTSSCIVWLGIYSSIFNICYSDFRVMRRPVKTVKIKRSAAQTAQLNSVRPDQAPCTDVSLPVAE